MDNHYQDANAAGENCVEVALAGDDDGEVEVDGGDDQEVDHDDEEKEDEGEGEDICSVAEFDQAVQRLREAGIQVIYEAASDGANCSAMSFVLVC